MNKGILNETVNRRIKNFNRQIVHLISSLIPRFAKKVFMLFQDVSFMPINRRTPSRTSLTGAGGALKERTSANASALMPATACAACSTKGSTFPNSSSISAYIIRRVRFIYHGGGQKFIRASNINLIVINLKFFNIFPIFLCINFDEILRVF